MLPSRHRQRQRQRQRHVVQNAIYIRHIILYPFLQFTHQHKL